MTIDSHDNIYYCTTTHTDDEWEWGEFRTTKRDSNGTKLWEKAFYHEFPYQHYARGIAIDSEDNIYVSGVKHSFNDPPRHFTVRYNPEGNLTWHHIYDSPGFESVVDNAMSKNDDLYIISNTELGGDEIDYQMVKYCTPAVGVITSSDLISSTQYLIGANATWNADVPEDTSITVEISNDAGISWHHVENGETIDFPEPGHILRYKLTFSTSNKTRTPVLYDITIHTTIDDNPPDDIPPTIAILKPENALYLRNSKILPLRKPLIIGTIDIEVAASDDQTGIERVEFFIDDELKETDITEPYNWTWDEKTRFRFRHTIKVIAYDEAGNYATSEISVRKFF